MPVSFFEAAVTNAWKELGFSVCGGRNLEHFYENKSNLSGSLHEKKK